MSAAARLAAALLAAALAACESEPLNGCDVSTAADATGRDEVEIAFGGVHGYHYVPPCVRVSAGTRVAFRGPLDVHPVGPGRVTDSVLPPLPDNPIRDTAGGEEAVFTFARTGRFGFFCQFHVGEGMMGAVFVE